MQTALIHFVSSVGFRSRPQEADSGIVVQLPRSSQCRSWQLVQLDDAGALHVLICQTETRWLQHRPSFRGARKMRDLNVLAVTACARLDSTAESAQIAPKRNAAASAGG